VREEIALLKRILHCGLSARIGPGLAMTGTADNPGGVPTFMRDRRGMMTVRRTVALTTGAVALAVTASCTLEQVLLGQWYTIHTFAQGTCPALDWHFVVDAHRSMGGYLDRDEYKQIATLSGTLNADDTFEMTATQPETGRQEHITGAFTAQFVTISLDGAWICEKQTFRIRPVRGAGGGGGGNG
jgi:hypothetical protein